MAGKYTNVRIGGVYSIKYGNLVELMMFRLKLAPKVYEKGGFGGNWRWLWLKIK